jgi:hypothetical protein
MRLQDNEDVQANVFPRAARCVFSVSAGVPLVQTDPVSLVPNTVALGMCGA